MTVIILNIMVTIKTHDNKEINSEVSLDINGNCYITVQDVIYQVNVDGKNKLVFETGDYSILEEPKVKLSKITASEQLLKRKVVEKLKNIDEEELQNLEDDIDNVNEKTYEDVYFKEDNDYYEEEVNDNLSDDVYFEFLSNDLKTNLKIHDRENGDIVALYETLIYDRNGLLSMKSKLIGEIPIYRLLVYPDKIKFRPIGNENDQAFLLYLNSEGILETISL